MADQVDYRALFEQAEHELKKAKAREEEAKARAEEATTRAEEATTRAEEATTRADEATTWAEDAEARAKDAEKQLTKTTFPDFLAICHSKVFMQLNVEKNKLLSTTGGLTRVDGKQYPRCLKPWAEFNTLCEDSFTILERAFQQQQLFPSPAGLGYLADKLSDRKLASEEDLKNFECLAVEGCALDVIPRFLELVSSDATLLPATDAPQTISFNNYPFGVVATDSDEEESDSEAEAEPEQDESSSSQRKPSRGRTRTRSRPAVVSNSRKPLIIKDDKPAYIGALGVAKRDMDAAIARAAAEAEERETSGPPKKRHSPERTKVHPDQWCFRHSADGAMNMRPLFVIEYKAAHKIDESVLRDSLMPDAAASLMEDAIRTLANKSNAGELDRAKRDIAKIFTQTYHYMIDYGLQFSYATTGNALIFLYLDPEQPSTLYYHLEEPKRAVRSAQLEDVKHSAVALVLAFVLISIKGRYMSQRWKKRIHTEQPKWPEPYKDMKDIGNTTDGALLTTKSATLAPSKTTSEACEDPQKQSNIRRRDQDDDRDPGPTSRPGGAAQMQHTAEKGALTLLTTQSSSTKNTSGTGTQQSTTQAAPAWTYPVDAPLSPALEFCTQACLLGLKTGGKKDPNCPNVDLHRQRDAAVTLDADKRHPISGLELRDLLIQQLANDMDHDCQNLERHGMYGAIGALFKLALTEYGYCFVGKGVQRAHRKRLQKEAMVYGFLEACQGRLVPVNLGVIELVDEYWTECGAHISHMMLMSFAGDSLWHHGRRQAEDTEFYHQEMLRTLEELRPYGVDHGDENNTNMVWNTELQRVMAIDFDHAFVRQNLPAGGQDRRRKASEEPDMQQAKRARLVLEERAVE